MHEDRDQLIVEKNPDSIEMGGHRLSGQEGAARLDVSARGLHSLPAATKHNLFDGRAVEEIGRCASVTQRMGHVGNMAHSDGHCGRAQQTAEMGGTEGEHRVGRPRSGGGAAQPRLKELGHSGILNGHPLIEAGLCFCESQRHAAVTAAHARIVRQNHVGALQADELADAEVTVEREQQRDGGGVMAGAGHGHCEHDGQLPRQRRVRLGPAGPLPAAKAQPRLAEMEAQLGPLKDDSVDGVRSVIEGPAQRMELLDVLGQLLVHRGRRHGAEGADGESRELEEAVEIDGVGA